MGQKVVNHEGHTIVVDTYELGRGFQWSYTIDGGHYTEGRDRPMKSEDFMLQEGLNAAMVHLENLFHEAA